MTDFAKRLADKAKNSGAADHTKTVSGGGGGDYVPPAAGKCRLRFVGYVETGKHTTTYQGKPKTKNEIRLTFEVSGPKHPPKVVDGKEYPILVVVEENLSLHEKANWPKLFAKLNYSKKATHPTELLGEAYIGTLRHRPWPRKGEDKADQSKWTGLDVMLRAADGAYSIEPPQFEDPETGEVRSVQVAPPKSPIMGFIWNDPDMEQWQSIFIDGEYPERKDKEGNVTKAASSKNVIQLRIRAADNFKGSPIDELLQANGVALDLPGVSDPDMDADYEEQSAAAPTPQRDPLADATKWAAPRRNVLDLDDDIPF